MHNRHVVNRFGKGVVFTEAIETIPEGAVLVFSAHGVSPEVRSKPHATCAVGHVPAGHKVHGEAIRYAKAGLDILLIGHADTKSLAPAVAPEDPVIESEADAEASKSMTPPKWCT